MYYFLAIAKHHFKVKSIAFCANNACSGIYFCVPCLLLAICPLFSLCLQWQSHRNLHHYHCHRQWGGEAALKSPKARGFHNRTGSGTVCLTGTNWIILGQRPVACSCFVSSSSITDDSLSVQVIHPFCDQSQSGKWVLSIGSAQVRYWSTSPIWKVALLSTML